MDPTFPVPSAQTTQAAVDAAAPTASAPLDPTKIIGTMFSADLGFAILKGFFAFLVCIVAVRLAVFLLKRIFRKTISLRTAMIAEKAVAYGGFVMACLIAFDIAGINVTALLGAAGIAGIAVGFAAQTSFANVISGLFLLSEKAFSSGDVIEVGEVVGVVESIDVLSVKVRTFDNRLVRIPNENLIKSNLINITRYPIRRMNFEFTITRDSDIEIARIALLEVADANPFVLKNPEPFFMLTGITPEGVGVFFGTWFRQERFIEVRNGMYMDMVKAFRERGIRFAFRTITIDPATGAGGAKTKTRTVR
ncbi:MAG: mechanosensitive ion channel family protein [Spirochaetes bacterium]|nr:mechanosensitive ion channel family protein [Spirochaetota bacterium]